MLTKERCKVLLKNVQFVPLFEKFLLSPEGQRAARLVIHQGLHLLWKSQTNEEWAQWGAKTHSRVASTTFSRACFETRITRFM